MYITKNKVIKDYNKLKKIAKILFSIKLYSGAMDVISIAAALMYNFNIFYSDEELESLLKNISKKIIKIQSNNINKIFPNKVVFYDYFSLDNRVLTEQYLQGLIDNNYEILYITFRKEKNKMANIINKLEIYQKAEIYFVKAKKNIPIIVEIVNKIIQFQPSKILYHSVPWDTIGFIVLSWLNSKNVDRFLINLTDHAFWLGCNCSDYFIEFRSYGVNISLKYRHINKERLLMLPYYPIQTPIISFQNFPFDAENKKVIVSGGSLYKIYGDNIYFSIVKFILNEYKDAIIFYLGDGDTRPLEEFIEKNKLNDRFFYSKERIDINEIIKRCYFYLGTYPIAGGLMSQYAIANNKIPISYTDKKYLSNNIDELFLNNEDNSFTFFNINLLYGEINKLMVDNEYYINKTNTLKNKIISKYEFSKTLFSILENKNSFYHNKEYNIDIKSFSEIYFNQENYFLHNYGNYFLFKKNIFISLLFIKYTFPKIISFFRKKYLRQD